ncbi:MAG: MerR family transcriptional regulator [Erysipelotrichaceae bacterium]|nr:MerR family transcriptional regulator [Erysipelotrichaceae bacterium]MDY5252812.1 MerR family transcriptional regulator [Erysipelotrichaceae bacterium]
MQNKEYYLTSGKFQKICNTTRDTLRYYRRKGLLVPYVDENGYCLYSDAQIISFSYIKNLREIGCSVDDIKKGLLSGDKNIFDKFMNDQYLVLIKEKMMIEKRLELLDKVKNIFYMLIRADYDKVNMIESNIKVNVAQKKDDSTVLKGNFLSKHNFFEDNFEVSEVWLTYEIEDKDSLYIVKILNEHENLNDHYDLFKTFVHEHHLQIDGDIYTIKMANILDPSKEKYVSLSLAMVTVL